MAKYAENTRVSIGRSRDEIERTLVRYGAEKFFYGSGPQAASIAFEYQGRIIKYQVPYPNCEEFASNKTGEARYEREKRRLWRVLLLALKAKLELVAAGLTTFEDEFLAQTCLPAGGTVSQWIQPQIKEAMCGGKMPKLLTEG